MMATEEFLRDHVPLPADRRRAVCPMCVLGPAPLSTCYASSTSYRDVPCRTRPNGEIHCYFVKRTPKTEAASVAWMLTR